MQCNDYKHAQFLYFSYLKTFLEFYLFEYLLTNRLIKMRISKKNIIVVILTFTWNYSIIRYLSIYQDLTYSFITFVVSLNIQNISKQWEVSMWCISSGLYRRSWHWDVMHMFKATVKKGIFLVVTTTWLVGWQMKR